MQWLSQPFVLNENRTLDEYDPPQVLQEGETVCEASYLTRISRTRNWFYKDEDLDSTLVRMKYVISSDIGLEEMGEGNSLPKSLKDKRKWEAKKPLKLVHEDYLILQDEIERRSYLDYNEEIIDDDGVLHMEDDEN